jgi:hypothetical protein
MAICRILRTIPAKMPLTFVKKVCIVKKPLKGFIGNLILSVFLK